MLSEVRIARFIERGRPEGSMWKGTDDNWQNRTAGRLGVGAKDHGEVAMGPKREGLERGARAREEGF